MIIIPAVDIIGGKLVRLEQGKFDRQISYEMSPLDAARKWEALGASLIHVVDLDGAKKGSPVNLQIVKEIAKGVNVPIEASGGFREKSYIQEALSGGVRRVVISSRAIEDFSFAASIVKDFGNRIIFSVDIQDMKIGVHGWLKTIDKDVFTVLKEFASLGVEEIICTDIKKDGTLSGPNVGVLKEILEKCRVKIISAGGIKTIEHIKALKKLERFGLSGVIVGRALYEGTLELKEAISVGKADNTVS